MPEETSAIEYAFIGGEECKIIAKPEATGTKVIDQKVGDDGKHQYLVAYGVTEWMTEDQLAKA
jgi:hypothetical protein